MMRDIVPSLLAHDPGLEIELPRDQRDLFIADPHRPFARALGRPECRLAFIECKDAEDGINEQLVLKRRFEARSASPSRTPIVRTLCPRRRGLARDRIVDVAYRDYEARDIIARWRRNSAVRWRRCACCSGTAWSPPPWAISTTKSCLGPQRSGARGAFFSSDELPPVPPPCAVDPRRRRPAHWLCRTGGRRPAGLCHRHRETLVLKPNRFLWRRGRRHRASMEAGAWGGDAERALAAADDPGGSWVLQQATRLPVAEFPGDRSGRPRGDRALLCGHGLLRRPITASASCAAFRRNRSSTSPRTAWRRRC